MLHLDHSSTKVAPVLLGRVAGSAPKRQSFAVTIRRARDSASRSGIVELRDSGAPSIEELVALADERTELSFRRIRGQSLSPIELARLGYLQRVLAKHHPVQRKPDPERDAAMDDFRAWKAARPSK